MPKKSKKIGKGDNTQMSLFDMLSQQRDERVDNAPGRLNVTERLLDAIRKAIKQAPKSRESIADEMSALVYPIEVTANMISGWVADSHPHRFPAEFLPALCHVTGTTEPLQILADAAGMFALQAPDALRAEIQQYAEAESQARAEKAKRKTLLSMLEGGEL
ncbi:hypothetical protein [uncultured Desulfuromonas sp.]|uniref:hypothetical protein n=1 Tax=uncultured Desulfuromonas sp. TaxID=181013 RepID=UPI002AAB2788|nr:hypothetical protein [uncultured Desulfuromonas sp.]